MVTAGGGDVAVPGPAEQCDGKCATMDGCLSLESVRETF